MDEDKKNRQEQKPIPDTTENYLGVSQHTALNKGFTQYLFTIHKAECGDIGPPSSVKPSCTLL